MHRLLLTAGALAAWLLMGHFGLLAVLLYAWASAMTSATNTPKTRALEQRVNGLVNLSTTTNGRITTTNGRVNGLSGQATGTALPAGQPTGGCNDNLFGLTTSGASAGTAHTHTLPFQNPTATHTHDFDGHTHDLPVV